MHASEASRATAAAVSTASSSGLDVDESIVLHDSNKLTLRLRPCDVVARIAPTAQQAADFEVDLAQRLVAAKCPVARLDPRIGSRAYERDGFVMTFWTYYERAPQDVAPVDYGRVLRQLHAGMRTIDVPAPHFTDRVDEARQLLADRRRTPALGDEDRQLLDDTLRTLSDTVNAHGEEQLLHGEPHPGNLLPTRTGPLFIDLETACRGPIEFDVAHAPDNVAEHFPGVDRELLRECRTLVLAMITVWRWDRDDEFPNGRRLGTEWLAQLRAAVRER